MSSKKILLIGGGGHCKSVLDSILVSGEFSEVGIIDMKENIGKDIFGVPVIGCNDNISDCLRQGYEYAFVTVGGKLKIRISLFDLIEKTGFVIPTIVDPSAVISANAFIEKGVFVGKKVVINAGAVVKKGAIINTGAIVEHDCLVGEFAHIAPGVVLCGGVCIGKFTHVGAKSVVKQQVRIGDSCLIGMGSVVVKDIEGGMMAYGVPCREVKPIESLHNS
ncbi:MAG: hypothetical protein PWP31_1941 [Clostridia bacterium]|nr:hypothetical protein [Clostridia bacterium]